MAIVTGSVSVSTSFQQVIAGVPVPSGTSPPSLATTQSPRANYQSSGTTADKCDLKHTRTYNLAAAPITLDLTALTDVFGNVVNFARIRSITIVNQSTTDGQNLTVGNAASNSWAGFISATGTFVVPPSSSVNAGVFVVTAPNTTGMPVSGTSKSLKLDPGANTFSVDIEICGCSA